MIPIRERGINNKISNNNHMLDVVDMAGIIDHKITVGLLGEEHSHQNMLASRQRSTTKFNYDRSEGGRIEENNRAFINDEIDIDAFKKGDGEANTFGYKGTQNDHHLTSKPSYNQLPVDNEMIS